MLKETRQLLSHSAIYGIGNLLIKLVAFVLIPLYARKLVPSQYGLVAMLELMEIFGKTIFCFGLNNAVLRYLNRYRREGRASELVMSVYVALLVLNVAGIGLLLWWEKPLVSWLLDFSPEHVHYFRLMLIVIFAGVFQMFFLGILQAEEKPAAFSGFLVLSFVLLIGLNLYKVGLLNQGVAGVVESKVIVALLNFALIHLYLFTRYRPRVNWAVLRQSFGYGFPLVFMALSATLLTFADRYLLKALTNLAEVGIYSMAYKFGMIVNMALVTPFRTAFFPIMFRLAEQGDVRSLYRKYHTYFLLASMALFLALSLFARELMLLFTAPRYLPGHVIVPLIAFSYVLFGLRMIYVNVLATQEKTTIVALSTLLGAVLNIGLNLVFIPRWGGMGAALATVLAYLFIALTTYLPQQRMHPIAWDWPRAARLFVYAALCLAPAYALPNMTLLLALLAKTGLLLVFGVLLFTTGFFTPAEKRDLQALWKRLRLVSSER